VRRLAGAVGSPSAAENDDDEGASGPMDMSMMMATMASLMPGNAGGGDAAVRVRA